VIRKLVYLACTWLTRSRCFFSCSRSADTSSDQNAANTKTILDKGDYETIQESKPLSSRRKPTSNNLFANFKHIDEQQHRVAEEFSWLFSLLLNFLVLIATGSASLYAYKTYKQTRRQADIAQDNLVATTRAWVKPYVENGDFSVSWDEHGSLNVRAIIGAVNKGTSPALNASVFIKAMVGIDPNKENEALQKACSTNLGDKEIVFSGEENSGDKIDFGDQVSFVDINQYRFSYFRRMGDNYKGEEIFIPIIVAACALYEITGDNRKHHTGVLFELGRMRSSPPDKPYFSLIYIGENIPYGQVTVEKDQFASFAD
jgi:hypothetical protein